LHPDDMIDIMYRYQQREEGYEFEPSDKGYKVYARRPGVQNAGEGGIKFYGWHVPDDRTEFDAAWQLTIPVYRVRSAEEREEWQRRMKEKWGAK
jgi:hypothetical protein